MNNTKTVLAALFVALAGAGTIAHAAPATAATPAKVLSLTELESRVTALGIKTKEVKIIDLILKVEGYDSAGRKVDLMLDRRTGEILSRRFDD